MSSFEAGDGLYTSAEAARCCLGEVDDGSIFGLIGVVTGRSVLRDVPGREASVKCLNALFLQSMHLNEEDEEVVFMGFSWDNPLNANPVSEARFPKKAYWEWWKLNRKPKRMPHWFIGYTLDETSPVEHEGLPTKPCYQCLKGEDVPIYENGNTSRFELKRCAGRPEVKDDVEYWDEVKRLASMTRMTDDQKASLLSEWRAKNGRQKRDHSTFIRHLKDARREMRAKNPL